MAASPTKSCSPSKSRSPRKDCDELRLRRQPFPTSGPLNKNLDLDRDDLIRRIGSLQGTVYGYILTTVKNDGDRFAQVGSAPNVQGGLVTLCTCKGQMRAGKDAGVWPGLWVAGVTGAEAGPLGKSHLFYLMRVKCAFASHRDLWVWLLAHAPGAARAKAADRNPLGDVYRPRDSGGDPYDPCAYVPPRPDHVHSAGGAWREDVDFCSCYGRRPALLVGDPHNSFLWSEPRVAVSLGIGRGCKVVDLAKLLA